MAPAKLRRTAMYPVYGLAEATLVVSFPQPPGEMYESIVGRPSRAQRRQATGAAAEGARRRAVASWPWASRFRTARCASPTTHDQELPENHVGHILIGGDNVTKGYFENPEANAKGFTRGRLAAHRRSRNDEGRQALHHRPRQGNHLRQRAELLPARHREHRDPRRRPRARQGGGRGRARQTGAAPTISSSSCCIAWT